MRSNCQLAPREGLKGGIAKDVITRLRHALEKTLDGASM